MPGNKECKVCGGNVRPLDEQSTFGCCEKCGIVYALKDRLTDHEYTGEQGRPEAGFLEGRKEARVQGRTDSYYEESRRAASLHWRCPDCDAEFKETSDTDLEFAKRQHVREYHPNRPTS